MIKKYFSFLLLLIFIATPVFATELQETSIKQVLSDYKDLSYRFDVGISYDKFRDEYSDIYVKVKRFQENNPDTFSDELYSIKEVYNDIGSLWRDMIKYRLVAVPNQTTRELKRKYPDLELMVNKGIFGNWNPNSTILSLNYIGTKRIALLESKVNEQFAGFSIGDITINKDVTSELFVYVTSVDPGGIPEKAGLQKGDRIIKINETPISQHRYDYACLKNILFRGNKRMTLVILRGSDTIEEKVIVLERVR